MEVDANKFGLDVGAKITIRKVAKEEKPIKKVKGVTVSNVKPSVWNGNNE